MTIDFTAELDAVPDITNEQMEMIARLAQRQRDIENYITKLDSNRDIAVANLRKIQEVELPAAMAEVGMSEFKLLDGTKITIKNEVYCSIPKEGDARFRAFSWLRENDLDGVIKNIISLQFGKGEDDAAVEAVQVLRAQGYEPQQDMNVHPQTLKALIKEQLNKGVAVPLDAFGAYTVNKSKIEVPK